MKWKTLIACILLVPAAAASDSVQCGNLVFGGTHTSRCFSDEFLSAVQRETTIVTERRFKTVKLDSGELFDFPFVIMTGEGDFHLSPAERGKLKHYLENGGFLLASAGCSNGAFDTAFRREMRAVFADNPLVRIPMDHPVFRTVYPIQSLQLRKQGADCHLEALEIGGKTVAVYSKEGLNNTANAPGCCCCGGNEITNSLEVNVNILAYALLY